MTLLTAIISDYQAFHYTQTGITQRHASVGLFGAVSLRSERLLLIKQRLDVLIREKQQSLCPTCAAWYMAWSSLLVLVLHSDSNYFSTGSVIIAGCD